VPQELKIHPTVVALFESDEVSVGDDKFLSVEFGVGAEKGLAGIDMRAAFHSWSEGEQRQGGSERLFGHWSRAEQKHQLRARSVAQCDLAALNVRFMKVRSWMPICLPQPLARL
jgi:hypothetical protein